MTWTDPGRCSSCKFCGMDMDMGPYCAQPDVIEYHPYGLSLNEAIKNHCTTELKLRVAKKETHEV